jgi:hypothetical protein
MDTQTFIDMQARLNLHEELLQRLYAKVFGSNIDGFDALMDEMETGLSNTARMAQPMQAQSLEDMLVAIAVQLRRFKSRTRALL